MSWQGEGFAGRIPKPKRMVRWMGGASQDLSQLPCPMAEKCQLPAINEYHTIIYYPENLSSASAHRGVCLSSNPEKRSEKTHHDHVWSIHSCVFPLNM